MVMRGPIRADRDPRLPKNLSANNNFYVRAEAEFDYDRS